MTDCPHTQTVADFVAGKLDAGRRGEMEAHVDGCRICDGVVARMMSGMTEPPPEGPDPAGPTSPPGLLDADPLGEGRKVGRYILIGRIGAGGMGTVYAAYDIAAGLQGRPQAGCWRRGERRGLCGPHLACGSDGHGQLVPPRTW